MRPKMIAGEIGILIVIGVTFAIILTRVIWLATRKNALYGPDPVTVSHVR
jgi:hypothetical protein